LWKNQNATGTNAVQTTLGYRPLYKTNVLNGLPAIRFDGSDDVLPLPSTIVAGDNVSFFMVVIPSDTTPIGIFDSGDEDSIRNFSAGKWDWFSGAPYVDMDLDNNDPVLLEYIHEQDSGRTVVYYKNGVFMSTNTDPSTDPTLWENLAALGSINFGYAFYTGDILEFIMYNETIGTSDREEVELYLKSKYGIA
jgi:hypothetical protein